MIYSKYLQQQIPITIRKTTDANQGKEHSCYTLHDGTVKVGQVDLVDTPKGVYVEFVENYEPNLYSGVDEVAQRIEVEHCLGKNLDTFEISAEASLNSHAIHYKHGMRFLPIKDSKKIAMLQTQYNTVDINKIVENIIASTKAGEQYVTRMLGSIPMYMPKELIEKYVHLSKVAPLLKGLK